MPYTITESCIGCTACVRKCPVNAISGERKAQHHIDPALCIECGACGRICASQAILDGKGRLAERVKPAEWPKPAWRYAVCVECRICEQNCPTGSIDLVGYGQSVDGLKPSQPFLKNAETCIACGFCEKSCPVSAITLKKP